MGKVMRALGLMSGTSLDGLDVAFIETDGQNSVARGPSQTYPYTPEMRALLRRAIADAASVAHRDDRRGVMREAEIELTRLHAGAVQDFLTAHAMRPWEIAVIGFHGQTVLHRPKQRLTLQLGSGAILADLTGCRVVSDMRAADVAAGGEGAPLVPAYHRALAAKLPQKPVAIVNIGGVANITYIGRDGRLIAFDTGPGNALIDDWMLARTGTPCDRDGAAAACGAIDDAVVDTFFSHPFFAESAPKSLDRNAFAPEAIATLSVEDGAATLAAVTARAIAKAREHLPEEPALWIVCGGGRRNRTIMRMLAEAVENAVVPAETAGLDGDSIEAEAWAYLAVRALCGLPLTFPETTGVPEPITGGVIALPRAGGEVADPQRQPKESND